MNTGDAAAIKLMIEDLDDRIDAAKRLTLDFVAQLLEMARLELLTHYHGIEIREIEAFCDAVGGPDLTPPRRTIEIGATRPRRLRGERTKPRRTRRSGVHAH